MAILGVRFSWDQVQRLCLEALVRGLSRGLWHDLCLILPWFSCSRRGRWINGMLLLQDVGHQEVFPLFCMKCFQLQLVTWYTTIDLTNAVFLLPRNPEISLLLFGIYYRSMCTVPLSNAIVTKGFIAILVEQILLGWEMNPSKEQDPSNCSLSRLD